jgi:hypothetical protein
MEGSTTYIALDTVIRRRWLWLECSQFKKLLASLEEKGLISAPEQKALLELAEVIKPCLQC